MTVSSRTPEGTPHECPLCGAVSKLEPAYPGGDAVCPACGQLVWWFRDRWGEQLAAGLEVFSLDAPLEDADSLDTIEIIMELEEEFGISVPRDDLDGIRTLADLIRYLREHDDLFPLD